MNSQCFTFSKTTAAGGQGHCGSHITWRAIRFDTIPQQKDGDVLFWQLLKTMFSHWISKVSRNLTTKSRMYFSWSLLKNMFSNGFLRFGVNHKVLHGGQGAFPGVHSVQAGGHRKTQGNPTFSMESWRGCPPCAGNVPGLLSRAASSGCRKPCFFQGFLRVPVNRKVSRAAPAGMQGRRCRKPTFFHCFLALCNFLGTLHFFWRVVLESLET